MSDLVGTQIVGFLMHRLIFFLFQKSDPAGLLVMERCAVELDLNEQQNFSFVIGKAKMN